jgi:O-antigen ligase
VLLWISLAGAAFACIDFYFQFHVPAGFAMQLVWLKSGVMRRAQGFFYESSTLGNFCAFFLVMIIVAAFPVRGRRVWSPWLLSAAAVVFGTALILSGSRASLVAVATAGGAFAVLRRVRMAGILATLAACLGAAVVVRMAVPAFWANYWSRLTGSAAGIWSYPNEVLSGRLANWKVLIDFLASHPWHLLFGIGYKTIPYTGYIGAHVVADNTWLSLLVETGITGVVVFGVLNAAILRTSLGAARSSRAEASFFGAWMFCFWCGEMVQMLTADVITYWRVLPVFFWVLAVAAREPVN